MAEVGGERNGAMGPQAGMGGIEVRDALHEAALLALLAPSLANSQPWRWHLHALALPNHERAPANNDFATTGTPDVADLYADRSRQIVSIDPLGRLMTCSCGAALHHARVALASQGFRATVRPLPDPQAPDLLARVGVAGRHSVRPEDVRAQQSIRTRRSDRRPFLASAPLPEAVLAELVDAASGEGVWARPVDPNELHFLGLAASSAAAIEARNLAYQDELRRWSADSTEGGVPPHTTVPVTARPVPMRTFAQQATLVPGEGDDRFAAYLVLCTESDQPLDWLRTGEAASSGLLAATSAGLASSVMSEVIEVPGARALVRGVVRSGYPQLVLRLGRNDAALPAPASPRRPASEMIAVDPPP